MSNSIDLDEMHLRHLAKRFTHLVNSDRISFPCSEKLTVFVLMTNPRWAVTCLKLLLLHSDSAIEIVAMPGNIDFPPIETHFSHQDPIMFWEYAVGVDLLNKALSELSTEFAVLMEDRVLVTSQWLSRLIWPFYDDEDVLIVSPKSPTDKLDGKQMIVCNSLGELNDYVAENQARDHGVWHEVPVMTSSCLLFRKSLLDEIGGLDHRLQGFGLKVADWCLRTRQMNFKLALCEDVYVHALQPLHDSDFSEQAWEVFCAKWGLSNANMNVSNLAQIDVTQMTPLQIQPLNKEQFLPPLVSAISQLPDEDELQKWVQFKDEQTYPNVQWILLCNSNCLKKLTALQNEGKLPPDTLLLMKNHAHWGDGLVAAQKMATGEYVVYLPIEKEYERNFLERMIDSMYKNHDLEEPK